MEKSCHHTKKNKGIYLLSDLLNNSYYSIAFLLSKLKAQKLKNKILLSLLLIVSWSAAYSKTWTVINSGLTFSPASLTIALGDTVSFVVASTHDAREVSQTTWNSNDITPLSGGFQTPDGGGLVLPAKLAAGTHYYVCSHHASFGMKGTIIVQSCNKPSTPLSISGNANICANTSNTYNTASVSGATSYTWTLPGGWSGTSSTNSINTTAGTTGGNVTVTANNSCGSSVAKSLTVTVNTSAPAAPGTISGAAFVCPNTSSVSYSITAVANATSYHWSVSSGVSIASGQGTRIITCNFDNTFTQGNISVTAINSCGSSSATTSNIQSKPAIPGSITGKTSGLCPSGVSSASYSILAVAGATSYTWTAPSGASITAGQGTTLVTVNFSSGTFTSGYLSVKSNNACGSSAVRKILLRSVPATPGTITGPTAGLCPAGISSATYTITAVAGAKTYSWIVPSGVSISSGQGTTSLTVSFSSGTFTSGNLLVTANNACGSSVARSLALTAAPALATAINGLTQVCGVSSTTYSIAAINSATSYKWIVPVGMTINSGQGTVSINVSIASSFSTGVVKVSGVNSCGTGKAKSLTVASSCPTSIASKGDAAQRFPEAMPEVLRLYPNPTLTMFNIEFISPKEQELIVEVYDALGKKLIHQKQMVVNGKSVIRSSLERYNKGVYWLRLTDLNGKNIYSNRIIKN